MTNASFHFHGDQSLQWNRGSTPEMPKQPDPLFPLFLQKKNKSLFGSFQGRGKASAAAISVDNSKRNKLSSPWLTLGTLQSQSGVRQLLAQAPTTLPIHTAS